MIRPSVRLPRLLAAAALLLSATTVFAQDPTPAPPPTPDIPAAAPLPPQIDLNLINLPTTMSIARHRSYFRLTHRFAGDLRRGSFGDLAADLFTLDKGAIIGLEYRFGITSNIQAGVHRSLFSKTIQTFGRWDALRQGDSLPVAISFTGSYEGLNNLRDNPNYLLRTLAEVRDIIGRVDRGNLRSVFDFYHVQINEGDVTRRFLESLDLIGHIQFTNPPRRNKPGVGELEFAHIFRLIVSSGYEGWVGAEYFPNDSTAESLWWLRDRNYLP